MAVRFRIRTAAGQEVSFASDEQFEDFVRSGDLAPDDLVYDGEIGSWSPARTHPMVLEIQYELDEAAEKGAADADAPSGGEAAADDADAKADSDPASKSDSDLGLSLAPASETAEPTSTADEGEDDDPDEFWAGASQGVPDVAEDLELALPEGPTAEEEKKAFLDKLQAERESDLDDIGSDTGIAGFSMESSGSFGDMIQDAASPELAPRPSPPPRAPDPVPSPALRGGGSGPRARPAPKKDSGVRKQAGEKGGAGRALMMLAIVVLLAGGGYVGWGVMGFGATGTEEDGSDPVPVESEPDPVEPEPDPVEPEPAPEPVIASTPSAVRERAQERYLTATQNALRDLAPIPEVWPTGPYLALPTDYPEVVDVWQDYASTIRDVRAQDAQRYRTAYEAALDDAAIVGEARGPRLQTALAAFAESQASRDAHFSRVEGLATAAIQSHNALVEAEGLIFYDATGSTGPTQGIARGTSGRNADAQLLLDQVVDLLESALNANGQGPRTASNVRQWVWDGFLDAATR